MFDWNDLRYFLAVGKKGSTIAAAKALSLSQSTVHRRLSELEKSVGRQIVIRHARGYRLTDLGQDLMPFAERVEDAVSAFERHLTATKDKPSGVIRLTCPESIGMRLIQSPIMDRFHRRYPALSIEFLMSDKFVDLAKCEADVAIRAGIPNDETLIGRKIADVPWAIFASRTYIERYGKPEKIEDLGRHHLIEFAGDIKDHHAAHWMRSVAPDAKVSARSNTVPGLMLTVKSGVGLAPLPVPLASREPELAHVLGPLPGLFSPIFLLAHPDLRRSPRVSAFFEFITAELDSVRLALVSAKSSGVNAKLPAES